MQHRIFPPWRKLTALSLLVGTVALVGCGGGSGGSSTTASTSSRATVFLTDSPREDFAHVWATIYHVELIPQDGSAAVVVFDDPSGRQIDLKTLRDASGERYSFLSSASVPAGTYTGANVTIGSTMQLMKNGVAVGDALTVDSSIPLNASGQPVVTLTFKTPKTLGSGATNVVVDFNLAKFLIKDSKVLPAVGEGSGDGLADVGRHDEDDYHGTVSGLTGTAPTLTFTLQRRKGETVTVTTTAATALFGTATLADGALVDVTGAFDPTTQTLTATQVTTQDARTTPPDEAAGTCTPQITGTATDLNATAGTFTVTLERAHGLTADQTTAKVLLATDAKLRDDTGATVSTADFFTALAATPTVSVEGTYDATTDTLTATQVRVVDTTQDGGWASAPHQRRDIAKKDASSKSEITTDWSNGTLPK